jgi:hypothetical protein
LDLTHFRETVYWSDGVDFYSLTRSGWWFEHSIKNFSLAGALGDNTLQHKLGVSRKRIFLEPQPESGIDETRTSGWEVLV